MTAPASFQADRFALVTLGHHFLLDVLPLRQPESHWALAHFVAALEKCPLPPADVDAVLLRCLAVLDAASGKRVPTLVERYVASWSTPTGASIDGFRACVDDVLKYVCITDGCVQEAIDIVLTRFTDPALSPRSIASSVNQRLSTLDVKFRRQVGRTLTDHIHAIRLERAAHFLATTNKSIKEIWVAVGYNDHSNFDHDFKRRFTVSPRAFRAASIRPIARDHDRAAVTDRPIAAQTNGSTDHEACILIVDDDDVSATTIRSYLKLYGYSSVFIASNGFDGLSQVTTHAPDLVLLDQRLPDMDGLEMLRSLRRKKPGDVPKVALFTADWSVYDRVPELESLWAVVISKLCDLDHLRHQISYLLSPRAA